LEKASFIEKELTIEWYHDIEDFSITRSSNRGV
jgi:hypothetical protein